ncbi:MAG: DUF5675 family protein [Nanobdellota archaeon]
MSKYALLYRYKTGDQGTSGFFITSWGFDCHTIELPWKDNQVNISCIPQGIYTVKKYNSPKYGKCFLVQEVPGRTYILFHYGNWAGDRSKGYRSNSLGCILVGKRAAVIYGQRAVANSRVAMSEFMDSAKDTESFELTIKDCIKC